jgi:hypothetical protein
MPETEGARRNIRGNDRSAPCRHVRRRVSVLTKHVTSFVRGTRPALPITSTGYGFFGQLGSQHNMRNTKL